MSLCLFFSVLCVYVWVVILKVHVTVNVCNDVHVDIVWSVCVCAINSYRNDVILYCAKYSLCRSEYIYIYIFLKILVCAILVFMVM